jgi:hypothetical protein
MSTSSPVRTRQSRRPSLPAQAGSNRSPRVEGIVTVVRSILLAVAAVSVIATSNYFAYLIGRKQVTYEELHKQVDRVVQLMDQKRAEEELALTTLKQRQERLEQNASGLTGLTTSTIKGKTIVTSEPEPAVTSEPAPAVTTESAPAGRSITAALTDDTAIASPPHEMRLQPPESSLNATTKQSDMRGVANRRGPRRHKVSPTAAPRRNPAEAAIAKQSGQLTTVMPATPDAGLARQ